jgi:hypothetical protein
MCVYCHHLSSPIPSTAYVGECDADVCETAIAVVNVPPSCNLGQYLPQLKSFLSNASPGSLSQQSVDAVCDSNCQGSVTVLTALRNLQVFSNIHPQFDCLSYFTGNHSRLSQWGKKSADESAVGSSIVKGGSGGGEFFFSIAFHTVNLMAGAVEYVYPWLSIKFKFKSNQIKARVLMFAISLIVGNPTPLSQLPRPPPL